MWEKEKLLATSNFSFSHSVLKRFVLQTSKTQGLFRKLLIYRSTLLCPILIFFSGKYIADFQKTSKQTLTNKADRIISNVPVDQCAKICVEQEEFNCASFAYCGSTTECRLSTAAMSGVGQLTTEPSMTCDVYTSKFYPLPDDNILD